MPRLAVDFIAGLNPLIDPVRAQEPYVIKGRNFLASIEGITEAFRRKALIGPPLAISAPKGLHSVRTEEGSVFLSTRNSIATFDPDTLTLTPQISFSRVESIYSWTYARVGFNDYFACRDVGLIKHDTCTGLWSREQTSRPVYAIAECGGRLVLATDTGIEWSAVGDGDDRETSTTTGAGVQTLPAEAITCFSYGGGVLIYTVAGIWRAELIQGIIPFRIRPFFGQEYKVLGSHSVDRWLDNTQVFLTPRGFFVTDGVRAPQEFQPLMSSYISQLYTKELGELDYGLRFNLTAVIDADLLFLSINDEGLDVGEFNQAFVFEHKSQQWGQMNHEHTAILAHVHSKDRQPGYIGSSGTIYEFIEDGESSDYTANMLGISSVLIVQAKGPDIPTRLERNIEIVVSEFFAGKTLNDVVYAGTMLFEILADHNLDIHPAEPGIYQIMDEGDGAMFQADAALVLHDSQVTLGPFRLLDEEEPTRMCGLHELLLVSGRVFGRDSTLPLNPPDVLVESSLDGINLWPETRKAMTQKPEFEYENFARYTSDSTGLFHIVTVISPQNSAVLAIRQLEMQLRPEGLVR